MEKVGDTCKADFVHLVPTPPSRVAAAPALRIDGDRNDRAHSDASSCSRDRRAGKGKVVDYTSSSDSPVSSGDTDEGDADPIIPDDHNFLPGGSPPLCGGEYESSSQAVAGSLPEGESDESPPHCSFPETTAMDGGNTTFSLAELGVSSEQYSSAPVEAYIPMPVERPSAARIIPKGDTVGDDGGLRQANYNLEPSTLPFDGENFDPYPADFPPPSQGFYAEQLDFVRPSSHEVGVEERNSLPGNPPPLDDSGSPPLEIDALSGHGIEWPTKDQPGPYSRSDDFCNFLLGRVKAATNAENPPPTEAIRGYVDAKEAWSPYDQRIQALESDICSLTSDADERDSWITEVRKRQKTRATKIAAERERITRLQREFDEARSSLDKEAREAAKDSKEEATLARDGGKFR
ncbi:hypothetical protein Taro_009096 [Colocasia esculenta]|uniref:Uncharacterized protein n=1 Tax=Colocasia esculenta TaxID=4460 RepID=A0A843TVG7_COLES|nr:hypothetical protein [Colocasia esculenta]